MNKELRLGTSSSIQINGGLCLYEESSIDLTQSPFGGLLNMCLDNGGQLTKRKGQRLLFPNSLGNGGINGLYANYKDWTIFAHSNKLYKFKDGENPIEIKSGISNVKSCLFSYNGILYIINGTQYLCYDGDTVKDVVPYVPRVSLNRKPDASQSEVDESWNMIGRGFKDSFNADGTAKVFKLSMNGLDADKVVSSVGGTEGNGFTVNRGSGTVTFDTAPGQGTNNVEITAYKTFADLPGNILGCTFGTEFSNRMFLSGNKKLPNFYFASGLNDSVDATYFPQKYQYSLKGGDKAVTGFKVHHSRLIVFKEDVTCTVESTLGADGMASFPIQYLNTDIGCDMPNSIQLVNNNIVFCNTYGGVHMIVSTQIPGEKSIVLISQNINGDNERPGLLQEENSNLIEASSVDFEQKYHLCVGSNCYVFDYKDSSNVNKPKTLRWFLYNNINASVFAIKGNKLFYGDRNKGLLKQFTENFNDFGEPINAVWSTKLIDFGYVDWLKTINYIWYTCKANSSSRVDVNIFNDTGEKVNKTMISTNQLTSFRWNEFRWNNFSWKVQSFAPTIRLKVKIKKVRYFKIELSNNAFNENLSVIGLVMEYLLVRKVK